MENFVFHNPTKIIFGRQTIPLIGPETAAYGSRVLLVYGCGSIKRNSIYRQVTDALEHAGAVVIEHGGVRSNPVLSHARLGIELVRSSGCEVICAVGGGSVIDTAKAIAAGAMAQHDVWKFFTGKKSLKQSLPVTCVLTLAASGSEMNSGMVVTNEATQQKFGYANRHLFPKVSVLDPEATCSVPPEYTAYGAVDALCHVLEFYCTTTTQAPVQDRLMEGLATNAMEAVLKVLQDPADYQARAALMWTATLALNGLTAAGLGKVGFPVHLIEHSLSALYDIPHGAGLAAILPGWLDYFTETEPVRLAAFGKRVFHLQGEQDGNLAAATGVCLRHWLKDIGVPCSLTDLGIGPEHFTAIAENAQALAKVWRLREYTVERIRTILERCVLSEKN
jgi:hypothetical protein